MHRLGMDSASARNMALTVLLRVENDDAYANVVLDDLLGKYPGSAQERGFATELAYGTLRWRGRLDWMLAHFVTKPLPKQHAVVRNVLRLAAYQYCFLPNIPASAVGNEAVRLVKQHHKARHFSAFVNAVVRKFAREWPHVPLPSEENDLTLALAVRTSHPEWLVARLLKQYGADRTRAVLLAGNEPPPLSIRVNRMRTTPDALQRLLHEQGVEASVSSVVPFSMRLGRVPGLSRLPAFQNGLFTAQDEGSQLVGYAVDPKQNTAIYDVCSAPGTKTTHLAELVQDKATIVASDVNHARLQRVAHDAARLGLHSIRTVAEDARRPDPQRKTAQFVLVDAPCSGSGVLRRRPDLRWQLKADSFPSLTELQREITAGAAKLVAPGGTLVYSTCSIDDEENSGTVRTFLASHPEFVPDSLIPVLPATLVSTMDDARRGQAAKGQLQLWPDLDGTDGFFIARFRRQVH